MVCLICGMCWGLSKCNSLSFACCSALESCADFRYNAAILEREESKKLFPFCTSTVRLLQKSLKESSGVKNNSSDFSSCGWNGF